MSHPVITSTLGSAPLVRQLQQELSWKTRAAHLTQMCSRLLGHNRLRCHNRIDAYRRARCWSWTSSDVRALKTMARRKTRAASIARTLKRTEGATRQKAFSLGLKSASHTHARSIQAPPLCGALLLVEWSGANWLSLATTFVGASSRHQRMH
jgi:hypothetical protein